MKTVSLKLDEDIFRETEAILSKLKMSRNRYINEALDFYNQFQRRKFLEKKLKAESMLVGEESLSIVKEFEEIDYGKYDHNS